MYGKNLQEYLDQELAQDPSLAGRLRRMKVYFDVALKIARIRKRRGLTQAELAKRLGTTQPNIARWETPGHDRYSLSRLIDIGEALGVTLDIRFVERADSAAIDRAFQRDAPVTGLVAADHTDNTGRYN